jgi:GNAT superfamily N-acetyltransferase
MEIRSITPVLVPPVAELYVQVFNAAPWNDAWTVDLAHRRLNETLRSDGAFGWVAWENEPVAAVVGVIEPWYDGDHAYIKECFVATDRQRQGIGRILMDAVESHLRQAGVTKIYLLTERESAAAAFYEDLGYSPSRRMVMLGKWLPSATT